MCSTRLRRVHLLFLLSTRRLLRLLRIIVPSPVCSEVALLVVVAIALVLRTYIDVWVIQNGTAIEG